MKKILVLPVVLLCIVLLPGCGSRSNGTNSGPVFSFDGRNNYAGFAGLSSSYSEEAAKKDGCAVRRDGKFTANKTAWTDFVKTASEGKNAAVRLADFYAEKGKGPYFLDVFYRDGSYYLFDSSSEDLGKHPFRHLLILTGKAGNPPRDGGAVVLTDDTGLTFDEVQKSYLSSDTRATDKISPFRLVMFQEES